MIAQGMAAAAFSAPDGGVAPEIVDRFKRMESRNPFAT